MIEDTLYHNINLQSSFELHYTTWGFYTLDMPTAQ